MRKLRSPKELAEILGRDPDLARLHDDLGNVNCIDVIPDGTGICVFKVYLSGQTEADQGFLWLYSPYRESYVHWRGQADQAQNDCRRLWHDFVRNPSNRYGSYLRRDVSVETIIVVVREYARLHGTYVRPEGVDVEAPLPGRIAVLVRRIVRDTMLSNAIKILHNYECQICGETILLYDHLRYAEAHHIRPLGEPHNGPDIAENIIVVCPNHHAMVDFGAMRLDLSQIMSHPHHDVGSEYVEYHNSKIYGRQKRG